MKKSIVIACVVALLIGVVAAGANAAAGNWIISIKAYSDQWTGLDKNVSIGVQGAGTATLASGSAAANKVEALASDGVSVWTKKTLATGATAGEFGLKIGEGGGFPTININIYNLATSLGNDQALDTNLVYKFKNSLGETLATFSSLANQRAGMVGWNNVSVLMKAGTWANGAADRGWFYTDTTPVINSAFLSLENYSFSFEQAPPIPEPGSLLALGSGLIGMAGFAIRRRRA
jgi:hypothetical protein